MSSLLCSEDLVSLVSSILPGVPDAWAEGFDADIAFRFECPKALCYKKILLEQNHNRGTEKTNIGPHEGEWQGIPYYGQSGGL